MDKLIEILHKNKKLYNTSVKSKTQCIKNKNNKHTRRSNVAINNILPLQQQYQPELFSIININKNKNNKNNNDNYNYNTNNNTNNNTNRAKLHNLLDNTSENLYKTRSNLPARLISLGDIETEPDEDIHNNKMNNNVYGLNNTKSRFNNFTKQSIHNPSEQLVSNMNPNPNPNPNPNQNSNQNSNPNPNPNYNSSFSKTVSSSFSSVSRDGHTHSKGNKIVNDSNKPYLQIDEMLDGNTQHYYIPKSTINTTPHNVYNNLDMGMGMGMGMAIDSYKSRKPRTRKPRTNKPRTNKPRTRKPRKVKT